MPVEVIMPKVDMDMTSGTIATWHIEEGATVEKGEPLFDIETDKATMEVESPASGSLHFVVANGGDIVEIGKCVGWIFDSGEPIEQPGERLGKAEGAPARPLSGSESARSVDRFNRSSSPQTAFNDKAVRATPHARRIARQHGIDLQRVSGNGPRGRITRADVEAYQVSCSGTKSADRNVQGQIVSESTATETALEQLSFGQVTSESVTSESVTVERVTAEQVNAKAANSSVALTQELDRKGIGYETVRVERMRRVIADRLTESKASVPHFYLQIECQVDRLLEHRQQANAALQHSGHKISINDMLVRASAQALMAVPQANASWAEDQIVRYKDANVSVAVSIEGGVVTPVVRQAQSKPVNIIANELRDLAERARNGKLNRDEYEGGSFSLSNLGMYGIKSFNAIINPPQSMILAIGETQRVFVPDSDGNPVAVSVMNVVLSCDHRVVDGVLGARWLTEFRRIVENPVLLGMDHQGGQLLNE